MIAARWATPQFAPLDLAPHVQAVVVSDKPIVLVEITHGDQGIRKQTAEPLFGGRMQVVTADAVGAGEYRFRALNAAGESIRLEGPMSKYDGRRFDGIYSLVLDDALPSPARIKDNVSLYDAVNDGERAIELDGDTKWEFPIRPLPIKVRSNRWTVFTHNSPIPVQVHPTPHSVGNARLWFDLFDFNARLSGSNFWIVGSDCTFYAGNAYDASWLHGQEYAWFERCAMLHGVSGFNVCDAAIDCEVGYCSGDQYSRTGLVWRSEAHAILSAGGRHPDFYQCDPRTINTIIADSTWTGRPAGAADNSTAGQGFFINSADPATPTRNVAVIGCVLDQDKHSSGDGAKALQIVRGAEDIAVIGCRFSGGVVVREAESVRRIAWQDNALMDGTPIFLP